jgi:hypothetical protein
MSGGAATWSICAATAAELDVVADVVGALFADSWLNAGGDHGATHPATRSAIAQPTVGTHNLTRSNDMQINPRNRF